MSTQNHVRTNPRPVLPVAVAFNFKQSVRATRNLPRKTRAMLDYLLVSSLLMMGASFHWLPAFPKIALDLWWLTLALVVGVFLQFVGTALWMTQAPQVTRMARWLSNLSVACHYVVAVAGCALLEFLTETIDADTSWTTLFRLGAIGLAPCIHAVFYSSALEELEKPGAWRCQS